MVRVMARQDPTMVRPARPVGQTLPRHRPARNPRSRPPARRPRKAETDMHNLTSRHSTGSRVQRSLASQLATQAGAARRNTARGYGARLAVGLLVVAAGALVAPGARAQQAPPPVNPAHDAPSPADLEPGVNTSVTPPP